MRQVIPFVAGSDTSEQAAHSQSASAGADEARVLAHIVSCGPAGSTDQEAQAALGMIHETASARRHALRQKGLVRDSGQRRKTPRGRDAVVWVAGRDEATVGAQNDRAARPAATGLRNAVETMRALAVHAAKTDGPEVGGSYLAVMRWLGWLARVER